VPEKAKSVCTGIDGELWAWPRVGTRQLGEDCFVRVVDACSAPIHRQETQLIERKAVQAQTNVSSWKRRDEAVLTTKRNRWIWCLCLSCRLALDASASGAAAIQDLIMPGDELMRMWRERYELCENPH